MKKFNVMLLVLLLIFSGLMFAKEMKIEPKAAEIHQLGRAPQSSNHTRVAKEFTLNPNPDNLRYDYDYYAGNTSTSVYGAMDLTNAAFTPTGAISSTIFPMAEEYNGVAVYRVWQNLALTEVNPDDGTETPLGTITGVAGTPTGLAWDWQSSTMYVVILDAGNAPHLATLDLTTLVATEIGVGTGMIIAMDFAEDGYIYAPAIDDDNLYKIDPATGASTLIGPIGYDLNFGQDVTYDYITGQLYTISCGTYMLGTYDLTTGALTQIASTGTDQYAVFVSTIAATEPDAPGAPTDVAAIPDAGGALSCDISWVCPSTTFGGDPLTELLEMRVYRDEVLIYTDSDPVIGGAGDYSDMAVPASAVYTYKVVGYNTIGEGAPVAVSTWVGEDVPNVVTDLLLEGIDMDGHLTWVNPTTGLNGGAFNNAIEGYHIVRNGVDVFEVTGLATEFTDTTVPGIGNYTYTVQAYNSVGDGGIATSNTALIADENLLLLEGFGEWLPGGWTTTGGGNWMHSATNNAGGTAPEAEFNWTPSTVATQRLISPVLDTSGANALALEFMHYISDYNGGYSLYIQTTSDGVTWNDVATIPSVSIPATLFAETVVTPDVGSATFQIAWVFDGDSFNINQWYVDDVFLSILEHGDVDGVVTDSATSAPIEGVEIFIGPFGPATTNAAGEYLLEGIVTGIQPVTAFVDGYYDFEGQVDVEADMTVTYDFMMDPFEFATLDGTVTDVDTGEPIEGAEISMNSVLGYTYDTTTGADGTYSIVDIVADTYDILCTAPMYVPGTVMGMTFDPGAAITQDFALEISITYFSDFEDNNGFLLSNDPAGWQWGAPTNGPGAANSGVNVWGTVLGDNYAPSQNWTLETTIPVGIMSSAYILEFWHWYDIEASYDGGNVKISIDNGASWSVLTPNTPYPGTANTSNPLSGEPIYCGHDQGFWELAQFDLASYVGENILLRWHFGCDSSVQYPGWFIDDVAVYELEYGSIEGTVSEFGTGNGIENAEVTAGPYSAISGADGFYVIDGVVTGTYIVECDHELYLPVTIEDVSVEAGVATTQDISMLWSEISVDVDELNSTLAVDEIETQTFTITNAGPGDLEYSIGYDFPATVTVRNQSKIPTVSNSKEKISKNTVRDSENDPNNECDPNISNLVLPPTDDPGDIIFTIDVEAIAVDNQLLGVEYDGINMWVTGGGNAGDPNYLYKIDPIAGTLIASYTQPAVATGWGIRDLCYANGLIYGGNETNFFSFDPSTETWTTLFASSFGTIRALAYDGNHFWTKSFSDPLYEFDIDGNVINSYPDASSAYGLAYDSGENCLWLFATPTTFFQYDLNGSPTGISYGLVLPNAGIVGGAFYYEGGLVPGKTVLGCLGQGTPDVVYAMELRDAASWVMVTDNISGTVPGNGGSIVVEVTFDATDLAAGDVLVADLVISNNSNYQATDGDDYILPVSLTVTGSGSEDDELPVLQTKLNNNYPNPFNPETKIGYSIKDAGNVTLEVYNVRGQLVKTLVNEAREPGNYSAIWYGKDNSNKSTASGVYFYKMKAGNYIATKKMILMK